MKNNWLYLLTGVVILGGCGGTSSGEIGTGYYTDSPIEGVYYICGSQSGLTDASGKFTFEEGKSCTFKLNDILLRNVSADKLSKNIEIKEDNIQVARFLQSLDFNGNLKDGIKIDDTVVSSLKKQKITTIPTSTTDIENIINSLKKDIPKFNGSARSLQQAKAHLSGLSVEISKNKSTFLIQTDESLTLKTNLNKQKINTYNWIEKGVSIGTGSTLALKDFSAGTHTVTLEATTDNNLLLNDTITFKIVNIKLNITPSKTTFSDRDNVKLTANVIGDTGSIASYSWKEANTLLSSEKELQKADFSKGVHNITLTVTTNDNLKIVKNIKLNIVTYVDTSNLKPKKLTSNKENVIVDKKNKLMWVSEANEDKGGCLAIPSQENYNKAKSFCSNLNFAGFSDWKIPSATQLSNFITQTIEANILPGYPKPCPILLSKDGEKYNAIVTRFGAEAQIGNAGDNINVDFPIGLRCVRSYTRTKPIANAGDDITVEEGKQFTFNASKSIDPDGEIVKYEWIFRGHVLNKNTTEALYSRAATQPAGDYSVILKVTDDSGLTDEDEVIVHVK